MTQSKVGKHPYSSNLHWLKGFRKAFNTRQKASKALARLLTCARTTYSFFLEFCFYLAISCLIFLGTECCQKFKYIIGNK